VNCLAAGSKVRMVDYRDNQRLKATENDSAGYKQEANLVLCLVDC
jgi:hypothetical protein